MTTLIEGDFVARATSAEFGANTKGYPTIRATLEILEGEHKGRRVGYDGRLEEKSIKYTKRDMLALGWKGKDVMTYVTDVMAAAAAGLTVPIQVEIATYRRDDGSTQQWSAVRSIGRAAPPLAKLESDKIRDVNAWLAEVDGGAPPPANNRRVSSPDQRDVPPPGDDDRLPF